MSNAFSPQGRNAVTSLPDGQATNRYGDVETYFKNCADAINPDGTVIDAQWFNSVTGNLRYIVDYAVTQGVAITVSADSFTMLAEAVVGIAKKEAADGAGSLKFTFEATAEIN